MFHVEHGIHDPCVPLHSRPRDKRRARQPRWKAIVPRGTLTPDLPSGAARLRTYVPRGTWEKPNDKPHPLDPGGLPGHDEVPMALPPTLIWSLRATLRCPWTWGSWVVAAVILPLGASWMDLSILSRGGAQGGAPGEVAFLAALFAVIGASTRVGHMDWLLARTSPWQQVAQELMVIGLAGVLTPLGVLAIGSVHWGWPGGLELASAAGHGLRLSLLALLLSRTGLSRGVRMGLLPLLGWWLPATLAGMPGIGPALASLLSAGTWPGINDSPFGSLGGPAVRPLVGWLAFLLVCTPGRGRHAVRDPR